MSDCMDFIGNQYLVQQFFKSNDPESRVNVLSALVSHLQADGLSIEEACCEVENHLKGDANAAAALSSVRKAHSLDMA